MKTLIIIVLISSFLSAQTDIKKYVGNPVLDVGPEGSWDAATVSYPSVIFNGANFKMWYDGYDGANKRIGYATSADGINWVKADDVNPVLDLGVADSWDDESVGHPYVLFDETIYKMWYYGYDGKNDCIGYATSDDGIAWTKHDGPVLDIGSAGNWDDEYVWAPKVYLLIVNSLCGIVDMAMMVILEEDVRNRLMELSGLKKN